MGIFSVQLSKFFIIAFFLQQIVQNQALSNTGSVLKNSGAENQQLEPQLQVHRRIWLNPFGFPPFYYPFAFYYNPFLYGGPIEGGDPFDGPFGGFAPNPFARPTKPKDN